MSFFKRFNREQLTLGAAAVLSVLFLGWQLTRGSGDSATGSLPTTDRVYSIARQSAIEFLDPSVQRYLPGRDIWEPPAAGRLPIPEIRPPEPKLGQMILPPFAPRPDDAESVPGSSPGRYRTIAVAANPAVPAGFPPEAEIVALKNLAETESTRVVDKRKQLMRPDGLAIIHLHKPNKPVTGRIVLDQHETGDQSILVEIAVEGGVTKRTIKAEDIDRSAPPPADEGVERGGEFGKEYLRRANKLKPDDAEGHRKLGTWCRTKAGMLPEAHAELKACVESLTKKGESGRPMREAVRELVEVLRELGNYDEAIAVQQAYLDLVKGTPNDLAEPHLLMGRLYADLGYHERSLISYDAAYQLEPGRAPPQIALARARLSLGESKNALDQIGALLLGGGPPDAEALTVQGLALLRSNRPEEAEIAFTSALKARPDHAEALNGLGVALALQRNPDAPAKFLAAIKADQYLIDAWINLALLYLAEGRPVEAEILFTGAAQRDPDSSVAAAGPGYIAVLKGSLAEAASAFERARRIQPDDHVISYALGRLKLRAGQAHEALELFRAALKSNPDYLPATTDAALAYLMLAREEGRKAANAPADKQGPFRERAEGFRVNAQTLLEATYRADPSSTTANAALGCVYATRGRVQEAGGAFSRASRPGIPDPLIDYGKGYLEYWYGADSPKIRLEKAEGYFKYGASHADLKDPADVEWKDECAKALEAIDDWKTQRIQIEESFTGNKPSLSNNWIDNVNTAPEPQVRYANNQANIGDSAGNSLSLAYAALEHRDIPRDFFLSVEGTLVFDATQGFEAGFSLYTGTLRGAGTGAGLHFVFLEDPAAGGSKPILLFAGQMMATRDKGPSRPTQKIGVLPAAPSRIRFKLERLDHPKEPKTWLFNFSVWDDSKSAWRLLTESKNEIKMQQTMDAAPTWMMQFWGRTLMQGRKWSVGVDDIRVLVTQQN